MNPQSHQLALPLPAPDTCQRWNSGRHSWRRTSEGGFDHREYRVVAVAGNSIAAARSFVQTHHYSNTWPSVSLCYGLLDVTGVVPRLVGVLTLGVPMRQAVLTGPFPDLLPYRQSLELNRLVLLDEVKAPAESWFAARCFRQAHSHGIRGILAHSDPQPRLRQTPNGPELLFPGHVGTIYQALNMQYLQRTRARTLTVLPDGSVLAERTIAKIKANHSGHTGAERRLEALGARPRLPGEPGDRWLTEILSQIGAVGMRHGGNHRYALRLRPSKQERFLIPAGFPYPKRDATR
ncbi:Mom family adenine methylcarbamoylation protein [Streptomyces avermitilis]